MEKSEQRGGLIHEGRRILLNIKKGAVPGPDSAEQGRAGLSRIGNDPVTRKDREGGAWGGGAVPAETGTPARSARAGLGLAVFLTSLRGAIPTPAKPPWQVHSPTLKS